MKKFSEQPTQSEPSVSYDERSREYTIKSPDIYGLAYAIYIGLGGAELDEDDCKNMLENGKELRPRSGVFAIWRLGQKLKVENRNMKSDEMMNDLLQEVVEQHTH